jgi:ribosomal protein S18 acetylase RimI-like enzyme
MELLSKNIISAYINDMIDISKQLEGDYWTMEHYLSGMNRKWELSYCEVKNKKMLGFMIVSDKGTSHHLHRIVVSKDLHGTGLGRQFLKTFMSNAKKEGKYATLKVHPTNQQAIKVYEHYGFVNTGNDKENLTYQLK